MTRRIASSLLLLTWPLVAGDLELLRTAKDRNVLSAAAIRVASSGEEKALRTLAEQLTQTAFLERLDDTSLPPLARYNLRRVFDALAAHPSPPVESLCLQLAADSRFASEPSRMTMILAALAPVKPMSEPAALLYTQTNRHGHYASNGPLLANNGSPAALRLLAAMFREPERPLDERIDLAHYALVPSRTTTEVIRMVDQLASSAIPAPLRVALLESLFDYQPERWFGKSRHWPKAASWAEAGPASQSLAKSLASRMASRGDLPAGLRERLRELLR